MYLQYLSLAFSMTAITQSRESQKVHAPSITWRFCSTPQFVLEIRRGQVWRAGVMEDSKWSEDSVWKVSSYSVVERKMKMIFQFCVVEKMLCSRQCVASKGVWCQTFKYGVFLKYRSGYLCESWFEIHFFTHTARCIHRLRSKLARWWVSMPMCASISGQN